MRAACAATQALGVTLASVQGAMPIADILCSNAVAVRNAIQSALSNQTYNLFCAIHLSHKAVKTQQTHAMSLISRGLLDGKGALDRQERRATSVHSVRNVQ